MMAMQAKTALVIEDNPLVATVIEEVLSRMGLAVLVSRSLDEARMEVERGDFDLALVDMNLQGETAHPLLKKLWALAKPFAVVTSSEQPRLKADFPDLVVAMKPLGVKALESIVQRLLDQSRARTPVATSSSKMPGSAQRSRAVPPDS